MGDDPDDPVKRRLADMTRMLVRRHRVRIEHLARLLFARGTMQDDEINREIGFRYKCVPRVR